jgi:hypothetical protein
MLIKRGPGLRRPFGGTIDRSTYPNMKELIPVGSNIRILFAFDPRRTAILLIAGDKTNRWKDFYEEMIPIADDLYRGHLRGIEGER